METTEQIDLLATPSDMDLAGREQVADGLRRLVADRFNGETGIPSPALVRLEPSAPPPLTPRPQPCYPESKRLIAEQFLSFQGMRADGPRAPGLPGRAVPVRGRDAPPLRRTQSRLTDPPFQLPGKRAPLRQPSRFAAAPGAAFSGLCGRIRFDGRATVYGRPAPQSPLHQLPTPIPTLKPPVSAHDHQTGSPRAATTLLEYGDYQCPSCGQAYGLVKQLQADLGDDLRFGFRNFPLREIHPLARPAALAAEAADRQGQFWAMHDLIYENQARLQPSSFAAFAATLRLDGPRFAADIHGEAGADKVASDFESGVRSGVNGTPTFFLNGELLTTYDGTYESLRPAVASYAL